jgi:hypothetical protein
MRKTWILLGSALSLAACGQTAEQPAANSGESKAAEPKRPSYCFFKDSETEKWSASRDAQGNVVVKGRAFRSDPRYKAELGSAEVAGNTASIAPTIVENRGYASPDNWWDVTATIPASAAVSRVTVACGKKTLAEIELKPKG